MTDVRRPLDADALRALAEKLQPLGFLLLEGNLVTGKPIAAATADELIKQASELGIAITSSARRTLYTRSSDTSDTQLLYISAEAAKPLLKAGLTHAPVPQFPDRPLEGDALLRHWERVNDAWDNIDMRGVLKHAQSVVRNAKGNAKPDRNRFETQMRALAIFETNRAVQEPHWHLDTLTAFSQEHKTATLARALIPLHFHWDNHTSQRVLASMGVVTASEGDILFTHAKKLGLDPRLVPPSDAQLARAKNMGLCPPPDAGDPDRPASYYIVMFPAEKGVRLMKSGLDLYGKDPAPSRTP